MIHGDYFSIRKKSQSNPSSKLIRLTRLLLFRFGTDGELRLLFVLLLMLLLLLAVSRFKWFDWCSSPSTLLAWLLLVWSSTSINEPSSINLNGPPGVSLIIGFFKWSFLFLSLVRPVFFSFVLMHWSDIVLFTYRTKKMGVYTLASFLLSLAMRTLNRRAVREIRKKKRGGKKRKHGRASDEWKGTITHPIASSAHTHIHTRTRRAHYLWFYLQNADFSKQTTTNGRKPSSTVLFCCARSDPALHAHTHSNIYTLIRTTVILSTSSKDVGTVCSRRYNQQQDEEKEKLTLYCLLFSFLYVHICPSCYSFFFQ